MYYKISYIHLLRLSRHHHSLRLSQLFYFTNRIIPKTNGWRKSCARKARIYLAIPRTTNLPISCLWYYKIIGWRDWQIKSNLRLGLGLRFVFVFVFEGLYKELKGYLARYISIMLSKYFKNLHKRDIRLEDWLLYNLFWPKLQMS